MTARLPPEVEASYSAIIDSILAVSDINTISAKRIRKGLQEKLDYDISDQKEAVKELILRRFDKFTDEQRNGNGNVENGNGGTTEPAEPIATVEDATNGTKTNAAAYTSEGSGSVSKKRSPADESEISSYPENSPPAKKHKKQRSVEDEDAAYAAKLQAELNAMERTRSTRGANSTRKRAPAPKKKAPKKKSADRVKDEDDSDLETGSAAEKSEKKKTGGFHKPMALSPALSELLGETNLSRPQCVKKIWEYIKEHDLQEPSDKRQIRCDDALRAVFKQDRVHMFTMNKILNQNLYALDE